MRPSVTAAALCAALLLTPAARADEVPQPVGHTVVEPPDPAAAPPPPSVVAQPAQAPAVAAPAPARLQQRSELGFTVRLGGAEVDRFLVGASFGGASGPVMVGFSVDGVFDVEGDGHRYDHEEDGWRGWCQVRADGRCTSRADLSLSGYAGVRHRTAPVFGGARLRLELAGELGWQWSWVNERVTASPSGTVWSEAGRAYPIAGLRGQVGLTVFRHATFGIGGYARQSLRGKLCVTTDGGCTRVGGTSAGVYFFGGGDWGVGG
jgi:hypothetical protein